MAKSKGVKGESSADAKNPKVNKEKTIKSERNETEVQDEQRNQSPEIDKDEGTENIHKDETEPSITQKLEEDANAGELDKETDYKTDTDLFQEEDIDIPETDTQVQQ